jgi:hypothetical protein
VNVAQLANTVYFAVKDDAAACATIRAELASLALTIATDPNSAARVTSATINGQTFSAQSAMTNIDRLALLRKVVWSLDNCRPSSRVAVTTF